MRGKRRVLGAHTGHYKGRKNNKNVFNEKLYTVPLSSRYIWIIGKKGSNLVLLLCF